MELFAFLIIIFLVYRLISRSPEYIGRAGEKKVIGKLGKLFRRLEGVRIFHNLTVKTPDGSTQIYHLILSPNGIFVIETKNMSGWIFGDERQRQWIQVLFKKKTRFQNPIHQNYKHVKAIQSLLSVDLRIIFSVVVFVGDSKFKTALPDNVVKIRGLLPYIWSHNQPVISKEDVDRYASIVISATTDNWISNEEHVKNVKNNQTNPICSRCGAPMVLRTARTCGNNGAHFWGCSKFPLCKAIKNVG